MSFGSDPAMSFGPCHLGQTLFSVLVIVSPVLAARFRSWRNCAKCFSARRIRLPTLSGWLKPNGAARLPSIHTIVLRNRLDQDLRLHQAPGDELGELDRVVGETGTSA
jgi:hypothetical protein